MNSLYSNSENQKLIWEMINKTPQINSVFPPNLPSSVQIKEQWFISIMKTFHEQNPNVYTRDQLLQLNRNTLSYMMDDLKKKTNDTSIVTPAPVPISSTISQSQPKYKTIKDSYETEPKLTGNFVENSSAQYTRMEPRSNSYTNIYEERQKEYDSMLRGVLPMPVQFEQIEDKKIQNITELTEQYRKSRELEIPAPIAPAVTIVKNQSSDNTGGILKLKLHENLPQEIIEKDVIPVSVFTQIQPEKEKEKEKHIHWSVPLEQGYNDRNIKEYKEIAYMRHQLEIINKRINDMETRFTTTNTSNQSEINSVVERIQMVASKKHSYSAEEKYPANYICEYPEYIECDIDES